MKNTLKEELENIRFAPNGDCFIATVPETENPSWDIDFEVASFMVNFNLAGRVSVWMGNFCLASGQVKEEDGFRHTEASMKPEVQSFLRKVFNLE